VISLKKDPTKKKQKFWGPLISRAILAGLIAFIISIPLEIKIFEEVIVGNEKEFKENKVAELRKKKNTNNNVSGISTDLEKKEREKAIADSLLALPEPNTLAYQEKKKEWQRSEAVVNKLKQEADKLNATATKILNNVPRVRKSTDTLSIHFNTWVPNRASNDYKNKYLPRLNEAKGKEKSIEKQKGISSQLSQEKRAIQNSWLKEIEENKIYADSVARALDKKKTTVQTAIDNEAGELDEILKDQKGFILRYEVLSYAAYKDGNSSILFFLWLIRVLFFLIEVLPTIVKLSTSVGQYDWAVYNKERDFIDYYLPSKTAELQKDLKLQEKFKKENEQYKLLKEQELYKNTVDEVSRVQNDIAQRILSEYEEKENAKVSSNIESFLQRSVN
jgi:hypothetical protein